MDRLWSEYNLLIELYESYNDQILILKGWSVTVGVAALIAAYTQSVSSSGRIGVVIASLSALPFWAMETSWKLFQNAYLERIVQIELCFDGMGKDCRPAQVLGSWRASYADDKVTDWLQTAILPHVFLPHLVLLAGGLVLAIWWPPKSA